MRRTLTRSVLALLAALLLAMPWSIRVMAQHPTLSPKMDAVLKTVFHDQATAPQRAAMLGVRSVRDVAFTTVLVKVTDGGQEVSRLVSSCGGWVSSEHGDIVVVHLPVAQVPDLAALASVVCIEASTALEPDLDYARSGNLGANVTVLQQEPVATRPTGRGVNIGLIDSGADNVMPAFRFPNGSTRMMRYWDQETNDAARYPTVRLPEGGQRTYTYGREYTNAQLEADIVFTDPGDHGTHVLGIATGRDGQYRGVAPDSYLYILSNDTGNDFWQGTGSGTTLDAYEYLASRAAESGLPMVVNQSQGSCLGPHDGSSLYEQAIQNNITSASRRLILCVSAGNNGQRDLHAQVAVPGNGTVTSRLEFKQFANPHWGLYNSVDVWLKVGPPKAAPRLKVKQYTSDEVYQGASQEIPYGSNAAYPITDGGGNTLSTVTVASDTPSALNGDDHFLLTFSGNTVGSKVVYEISFINSNGAGVVADLYMQRNTEDYFYGRSLLRAGNLGTPATTPGAITVGNYVTRTTYTDIDGRTWRSGVQLDLDSSSSVGPPRSGVNYTGVNQYKPDVAAPGSSVVSQCSAGSKSGNRYRIVATDLQGKNRTYLVFGGTSMSTPMVSGIVALMLQDNPFATAAQIKAWLTASTRAKDDYTGTLPNANWGYGKVDAQKAFNAVVSPTPTVTSAVIPAGTVDIPGIGVSRAVVVQGSGMAFTSNVFLDGQVVENKYVYWLDHRRLVVAIDDSATFRTLMVQNPKALAGGQYSAVVSITLSSASQADLQAALNQFKDVVPSSQVTPGIPVASAPSQEGGGGGGGCFIATAAWGSPLEPHVVTLREFRDRWLLTHAPGRAFVALYYRCSPPVAQVIAAHSGLRWATRVALTPVVLAVVYPAWAFILAAFMALVVISVRRRLLTVRSPVVALALLTIVVSLLSGCGSGSTSPASGAGVAVGSASQTATVVLQSSLATRDARTSVPADVTHIRVTGVDWTGRVLLGPVVYPKAASITIPNVPVAVTALQLDYLSMGADGLLTGTCRQAVVLLADTTLVIQDPPITAVTVTAVAVSPSAVTLTGGAKRQFLAMASLSNRTSQDVTRLATWTSSNPGVALVSLFGQAETQMAGQADIGAQISGVQARGVLTVTPAVATELRIAPPDSRLAVGWVEDLHALATLSDQTQVDLTQTAQWSSSNPAVATVDQAGHVSGVAPGPVTIRAVNGALSATATLTVTTATVTAIEVDNPQADQPLVVGQQLQMEALGVFSDGSTVDVTDEVLWASSQPGVATIDVSGVAMAMGAGETEITASLGAVTSTPSPLVVESEIVNIIISPNNPTLQVGAQQPFTATGVHADGSQTDVTSQVTWVSSDPTIASFSGNGLLTAKAAGTTFVRAVLGTEDGRTEVLVNP